MARQRHWKILKKNTGGLLHANDRMGMGQSKNTGGVSQHCRNGPRHLWYRGSLTSLFQ